MFQCKGNSVLIRATFNGKDMLPIAPMRIDNKLKRYLMEKPPKLSYANM